MSLLDNIIDSLVSNIDAGMSVEMRKPLQMAGAVTSKNSITQLRQGHVLFGKQAEPVAPGSFYFIPAGQSVYLRFGQGNYYLMEGGEFKTPEERQQFVRTVSCKEDLSVVPELATYCRFDVLLYNAISFFEAMDIPPFIMPYHKEMEYLLHQIASENELKKLGHSQLVRNYLEELIIHVCRFIESQPQFSQFVEKLQFLTDRRLVGIVKFIQDNLDKDLSNKKIAEVAFVSEDYVGQFFKSATGKNLQDYIENQRLERAMHMIQTRPDTIQEISVQVGFKDPAYFSRRFKMKFGINANFVRSNRNQFI